MAIGQRLGSRSSYIYSADNGQQYVMQLDDTLAGIVGNGLTAYTGQPGVTAAPKRFKPRGVYWQMDNNPARKFLVCGTADGELYSANVSQRLTIDGDTGATTGRKGEKISFSKAQLVGAPAPSA